MRGPRAAIGLLLALVVGSAALPAAEDARAASGQPVAVVAYYDSLALPRLVDALDAEGPSADVPVLFGNYWGSPRPPKGVKPPFIPAPTKVAGPRYAYTPIMPIVRGTLWERRRVSPSEAARLAAAGQGRLAGRVPQLGRLLRGGPVTRRRWAEELGRRFRDRVRAERRAGRRVVGWQFDEIPSEVVGGRRGGALQSFTAGILRGLHRGRSTRGDQPERGVVYAATKSLALAGRGRARPFWNAVNRTASVFVGEEYPAIVGSASGAARRLASGQRRMAASGGAQRALARRYVVGLTPGYRLVAGLGGNVKRRSRAAVNAWRLAYVRARARSPGVVGFAQFNFRGQNANEQVMRDVARALAEGMKLIAARGQR